ncbi:uncharacterized protein LOC143171289 isoform X2 [Aptenodytes patagonicus]|uniref:uncharacterized protein LOC143171289 isoform X2 n=1 Tax=Aptenodytes patagonicus TaxID=9234 RepID=UPI003FA180E7
MKRKRKITALEAPNPPLSPLPGRLPAVSLLEEEENGEQVLVKNESYLPILKNKDQRKRLVRETFSFLDSSQPSEIERRSGEIPNCLNGTNFWLCYMLPCHEKYSEEGKEALETLIVNVIGGTRQVSETVKKHPASQDGAKGNQLRTGASSLPSATEKHLLGTHMRSASLLCKPQSGHLKPSKKYLAFYHCL